MIKKHHAALLVLSASLFALTMQTASAAEESSPKPLSTIESLDVPRYMGRWYEIAKYPNWFQKKCIGNTRADYSLTTEGSIKVVNHCRLENGKSSEAIGTARQIGESTSPKLKVRFAPVWLTFLPMVWGDYWVIDIDTNYQLVAVSEPKREYLWILSRTPQVPRDAYAAMLQRLQAQGFDINKLETTPQ